MKILKNKISLAPMVDRTDNNFRHFVRMLSPNILLYTEMITDKAIINNSEIVLNILGEQNPIVLQIATNNKDEAREAIRLAEKYEYNEININVGCPSDRVSNNQMGAYLMSDIELVEDILSEITKVTNKPITIKHRIGIDGKGILKDDARYYGVDFVSEFINRTQKYGVQKYIIHAREAILKGLNPKQNRTIPPLDYKVVYEIKKKYPNLFIEINGGVKTISEIKEHLKYVDGVMIGREIYNNPMFLLEIEEKIFNNKQNITKLNIINNIINHFENEQYDSKQIHRYLMHLHGLYLGENGSKAWKQICSNSKITIEDIKNFLKEYEYDK